MLLLLETNFDPRLNSPDSGVDPVLGKRFPDPVCRCRIRRRRSIGGERPPGPGLTFIGHFAVAVSNRNILSCISRKGRRGISVLQNPDRARPVSNRTRTHFNCRSAESCLPAPPMRSHRDQPQVHLNVVGASNSRTLAARREKRRDPGDVLRMAGKAGKAAFAITSSVIFVHAIRICCHAHLVRSPYNGKPTKNDTTPRKPFLCETIWALPGCAQRADPDRFPGQQTLVEHIGVTFPCVFRQTQLHQGDRRPC